VSAASGNGITRFCESGGIKVLASQMSALQDGKNPLPAGNACFYRTEK